MPYLSLIIGTLFFFGGFVLAVLAIRSGRSHIGRRNMVVMALGFLCQCWFLKERGDLHGRCPITNGAEILVFISWSIVIMYFILGRAFRLSLLGVFTAPMVFVFQLVALLLLWKNDPGAKKLDKLDSWLEMHASMSLLAYGAFALAAVAGVMYLIQNRQLKSKKPGRLSSKLPPIRYLSDALVRLLIIGLILTTVGIVSAFFMQAKPSALHLAGFSAVWVIYALILLIQFIKGLTPKIISVCSIGAFVVAVLTLMLL